MLKISGGVWAGRRLVTPAGPVTRPTGEKLRAALANSLAARGALAGARVLDLYAGSGALALEMLSRGAADAILVERDRAAQAAIRANLTSLGLTPGRAQLIPAGVEAFAVRARPGDRFDLVLADPPYELSADELGRVLADLAASGVLDSGADIVIERSSRSADLVWPDPLVGTRTKRYGDSVLWYGRAGTVGP